MLLTLGQIAERTGISYGTMVRYAKLHEAKIPSEGMGRKKRYPPAAVKVFEQLREETKRGRPVRTGTDSPNAGEEHQELRGQDYTHFLVGIVDKDRKLIADLRNEIVMMMELLMMIKKSIAQQIDTLASSCPGVYK